MLIDNPFLCVWAGTVIVYDDSGCLDQKCLVSRKRFRLYFFITAQTAQTAQIALPI